jgi:hypothetical protein
VNDIHHITVGFAILSKYDTAGEVNVNHDPTLYAGPEDMDENDYTEPDRINLEANYWHYDDTITRWGYGL